jgi:hypothetical protein
MVTRNQFQVGDRVALRGEDGRPDAQMMGVVEKVEFQRPPGNDAHNYFYVVRHSNGQLFAAAETELVGDSYRRPMPT